ncbi:MAG: hypothetical protein ACFCD0_03065 [Gemmataceae bacterium]
MRTRSKSLKKLLILPIVAIILEFVIAKSGNFSETASGQLPPTQIKKKSVRDVYYPGNENGLKFAFSSDTLPNRWWLEHTKGADIAIHECFIPPDMMVKKYGMTPEEAVFVGSQAHTAAVGFGKMMALTKPRLAVAYHFQNDFDTAPVVLQEVRKYYKGPLDLAEDFMVWNVTKKNIRTRMAIVNQDSYPHLPIRAKQKGAKGENYQWTELSLSGVEPQTAGAINKMIDEFNKKNGTNVKATLTGLPFQKKKQ